MINEEKTLAPPPDLFMGALSSSIMTRRLQMNLSQDDLCKRSGLNRSVIVRIEAGLLDADVSTLWKISTALDTTIATLFEMAEKELGY